MTVDLHKERPARAFAAPDLRPYVRGGASVGRALGSGSAALARRLHSSTRIRTQLGRISWGKALRNPACWAGTVFVVVAVWSVVGRYALMIGSVLAGGWVVLALVHSAPEAPPVEEGRAAAETAPVDPREAFIEHLVQAIGTRPGIHLRELITRPPLERCTIADIRALCEAHGVPVRASQKVGKQTTVGIRLADVLALSPGQSQETALAG